MNVQDFKKYDREDKDLLTTHHSYLEIHRFFVMFFFFFFQERLPSSRWGRVRGGAGCRVRDWGGTEEEVLVLATNGGLGGALWAALASYRLLRLAPTHDRQQRLQEDVQQRLHHHLHLLLHTLLLQEEQHRHTHRHAFNKSTNPEVWLQFQLQFCQQVATKICECSLWIRVM